MAKKKRRKLSKAQAREQARRKQRQRQIMWALVGVVTVAVVVVLVLIAMSGGGGGEPVEPLRDDVETGITAEGYPYRGSADAPVTIVEVSDYNCSVCRDFSLSTARLIDDELVATGQVKYVVHPFALWEESVPIVEAAACARDQGGFWEFHHQAFADHRGTPRKWADVSGLDIEEFQACLDEGRHREEVLAATRNGKEDLGVSSTPTFFVNGVKTQLLRDEAYIDTIRKAVQAAQAGLGQ